MPLFIKNVFLPSCHQRSRSDRIRFHGLGCIYKQINPNLKKSHLTQSPSLNINSALAVLLCCWAWKRPVTGGLPASSGFHDGCITFSFKKNAKISNLFSVQSVPHSSLTSRKSMTTSRKGERKLSHNWWSLEMYLSISPNESGSLAEAQWPWDRPAVRQREHDFVDQAHISAMASSYQLENKSWYCLCLVPSAVQWGRVERDVLADPFAFKNS